MNKYHTPVLLKEVTDLLQIKPGRKYIDATIGGGGHTEAVLSLGGRVLGIDLDTDALNHIRNEFKSKISDKQLTLAKGNFRDLKKIAHSNDFGKVSGILFDLGVSSHQIDTPERGFSFLKNGPLDMRMDKESQLTAEKLVNLLTKGELYELFNELGQDSCAWSVSNGIVRARRIKAIQTTDELAKVIGLAYGIKEDRQISDFNKNMINRKVFQALRIAVNDELENLSQALPQALELLENNGRLAVISFHSLEDRIAKNAFKGFEKNGMGKILTVKPIVPGSAECLLNPRAKPAKLRVFERTDL